MLSRMTYVYVQLCSMCYYSRPSLIRIALYQQLLRSVQISEFVRITEKMIHVHTVYCRTKGTTCVPITVYDKLNREIFT